MKANREKEQDSGLTSSSDQRLGVVKDSRRSAPQTSLTRTGGKARGAEADAGERLRPQQQRPLGSASSTVSASRTARRCAASQAFVAEPLCIVFVVSSASPCEPETHLKVYYAAGHAHTSNHVANVLTHSFKQEIIAINTFSMPSLLSVSQMQMSETVGDC